MSIPGELLGMDGRPHLSESRPPCKKHTVSQQPPCSALPSASSEVVGGGAVRGPLAVTTCFGFSPSSETSTSQKERCDGLFSEISALIASGGAHLG